ncbi:MAG TPA: HAMP domain-containing sensor histidine kinase [Phycisphaerales bacterium]|nr:HAMP domain-containing sensor histidine kinase [Phycisphaerales bacterium]
MSSIERPTHRSDTLLHRIEELEAQLSRARAEFEASSRLSTLGLLTGAIAHEFSNILTPVLSYARAALERPDDRELASKALDRAAKGVEQAARVANSVLRLAGSGLDAADEPLSCDPAEALAGALECMGRRPQEEGVELRVVLHPGLRLRIRRTDLEHVLLNLLLNAVRALKPGGGVLELTCRPLVGSAGSTWNTVEEPGAELTVRDTGPGISRELLDQLFEPLLTRTTRVPNRNRGHGLGLVICRRLIEAAGGTISVESEVGRGAVFRIRLGADAEASQRAA